MNRFLYCVIKVNEMLNLLVSVYMEPGEMIIKYIVLKPDP